MVRVCVSSQYHLAAYLARLEGKRCQQGLIGIPRAFYSSKELQSYIKGWPAEYPTNRCFFAKAHKPKQHALHVHNFGSIWKHNQPSNSSNELGHWNVRQAWLPQQIFVAPGGPYHHNLQIVHLGSCGSKGKRIARQTSHLKWPLCIARWPQKHRVTVASCI